MPQSKGSRKTFGFLHQFFTVYRFSPRAVALAWRTSRPLTVIFALLTLAEGLLPAAVVYLTKLIFDAIVQAAKTGAPEDHHRLVMYIVWEVGIVVALEASRRGSNICKHIFLALLKHRVSLLVLAKALKMSYAQFEDSTFYDRLRQAREGSGSGPFGMVACTFDLVQKTVMLVSYGWLLYQLSPLAVLALFLASLPPFFSQTYFSGATFRLFLKRTPEARKRAYLETVLTRDDFAKEVQLFRLGPMLVERYRGLFREFFHEDKSLAIRQGLWGQAFGLVSILVFYGAYAWIAFQAVRGRISIGEMTMYLLLFKQGQAALSAGVGLIGELYQDNLYISSLFKFLDTDTPPPAGIVTQGLYPSQGLRFENVWFTYPGVETPALRGVSFQLKPGEKLAIVGKNGSGKTTLIKLLTRLYTPQKGRIYLDGLDIQKWEIKALRERVGVIFQDFVQYQFSVGENLGVGDVDAFHNEHRWWSAAKKGMATSFIQKLPNKFHTQLGRWFDKGYELSGGQWQKVALARAFMRESADILVLDEPTAAMDAETEAEIFQRFRERTQGKIAILISHRFSTVRMADKIIVLENGKVLEEGTHDELMSSRGRYAYLFTLQAAGYQ